MAGNLGFFFAGEGEDFGAGAFFTGVDAEEFEALADEVTDEPAVLADASGEDEEVESAEFGGIGADEFSDGGGEDINGQSGIFISGFHGGLEAAHVGFPPGERSEAGLAIEEGFESVGVEAVVAHEKDEDAGVEVSGAGGHGDAAGGGESHAGVDGAAVEDGGEAGSVAEVSARRRGRDLRTEAVKDGFVGEAVEAVSLDAFVVDRSGGDSGRRSPAWWRGRRCRSRRTAALGEEGFGFADERERGGNVQRGEVECGFERGEDLRT